MSEFDTGLPNKEGVATGRTPLGTALMLPTAGYKYSLPDGDYLLSGCVVPASDYPDAARVPLLAASGNPIALPFTTAGSAKPRLATDGNGRWVFVSGVTVNTAWYSTDNGATWNTTGTGVGTPVTVCCTGTHFHVFGNDATQINSAYIAVGSLGGAWTSLVPAVSPGGITADSVECCWSGSNVMIAVGLSTNSYTAPSGSNVLTSRANSPISATVVIASDGAGTGIIIAGASCAVTTNNGVNWAAGGVAPSYCGGLGTITDKNMTLGVATAGGSRVWIRCSSLQGYYYTSTDNGTTWVGRVMPGVLSPGSANTGQTSFNYDVVSGKAQCVLNGCVLESVDGLRWKSSCQITPYATRTLHSASIRRSGSNFIAADTSGAGYHVYSTRFPNADYVGLAANLTQYSGALSSQYVKVKHNG